MRNEPTSFKIGRPVAIGVFLVIVGLFSISLPMITTLSISWILGLSFLVSGIAQVIHFFTHERSRGQASRLLLAALSIISGVVVLRNLFIGAMTITLSLAFYFLMSSVGRGLLLYEWGAFKGRVWLILSTLISFCLGIYLLMNFPAASLFVPGLFFGIDLVFFGFSLIAFALFEKKSEQQLPNFNIDKIDDNKWAS